MATPVGPLAVLVIKRSLTKGYKEGLATALGIALADGIYALFAALGLTAVSNFMLSRKEYLFMGGGLLLILLGIRALKHPPILAPEQLAPKRIGPTIIQTLLLTLTNPLTLLTFLAAFTAAGFEAGEELSQALLMCLGVFLGSTSWFMTISLIAGSLRKHVTPYILNLINTISGSVLVLFGSAFLIDAAWELLQKVY